MDAIVLAGGRIEFEEFREPSAAGGLKCLLDVGGKPMVQWVLDALSAARSVERVVVVGLPSATELRCAKPLTLLPAQGDMIASIRAAAALLLRERPDAEHALIASADAPLITGEMVDWLAEDVRAHGDDLTICAVERWRMEERFPGSKRTYIRLQDVEVCGGDLNACRLSVTQQRVDLAERLSQARKQPWRLALFIGPGTLLALMQGRLTLEQATRAISRRLGVQVRVALSPYPEIGMDVDKPGQLAMVREELATGG